MTIHTPESKIGIPENIDNRIWDTLKYYLLQQKTQCKDYSLSPSKITIIFLGGIDKEMIVRNISLISVYDEFNLAYSNGCEFAPGLPEDTLTKAMLKFEHQNLTPGVLLRATNWIDSFFRLFDEASIGSNYRTLLNKIPLITYTACHLTYDNMCSAFQDKKDKAKLWRVVWTNPGNIHNNHYMRGMGTLSTTLSKKNIPCVMQLKQARKEKIWQLVKPKKTTSSINEVF